ncbi:hypothetical protein Fcan01_00050 [Folsomia candida]|uniref:Uncharacterized protein n=1 Tax=Folsomia candida TaxID=158441 RepID=A0A226EXH7_FOLCA|nr:hypothetical protein Fcan01_00050 [Folsomia candida]
MPAGCAISKDANDQSLKYCFSLHRGNELFMKSTHDLIPNITDWKTQTQVLLSIEAKCGFYPDCAKSMPVRETDYAWQIFYGTMEIQFDRGEMMVHSLVTFLHYSMDNNVKLSRTFPGLPHRL